MPLSPGAWRVRREFACIADPKPPTPWRPAVPVGTAAARALEAFGIGAEDALAARIERDWEALAGPDVARRARPGPVERGTLLVSVRGSAWFSALRGTLPPLLLPKLRAALAPEGGPCPVRAVRVVLRREA